MNDNDDEYLGSDSSEEEDLEFIVGIPRARNEDYIYVAVNQYDEETFFMHFRMRREHVMRLANANILWFVGYQTGSFRDVADRFNVTISSLNRIIRRVSVFLSNMSQAIIVWPNEPEKQEIEEHFRQNGFPGVMQAVCDITEKFMTFWLGTRDQYMMPEFFEIHSSGLICRKCVGVIIYWATVHTL
ncbi:hypothetical protein NQ315_014597 [Exocentrus adspersus]|uniref:Nuclease HARBI1 n=1 Tax=Exocentrus adspersus TaxID=1586481 RepID=A0AAV8VQV7_9CUCU|nr:hypothetical protein NQ315_014597 [Exocentrus adspersus]